MKKHFLSIALFVCALASFSQEMTLSKLEKVLQKVSSNVIINQQKWSFSIENVSFIVVADSLHNRMRIISPIMKSSGLTEELKTASLIANFHTALDIKYAISDDFIWAAFIHPLKELSEEQIMNAISQVYYGNVNFGTTFSSTSLIFNNTEKNKKTEKTKEKHKMIERI